MINKVFLDMDGVLVDFNRRVCEIFNFPYPPKKYDFFEEIREKVNTICTAAFWELLDWKPDGKEILKTIEDFYFNEEIYLLTCPMPNPDSWTGKRLWVERNMPDYKNRLIVTPASKEIFAYHDILLIDDKDSNVLDFRAAGGEAILIARPWNTLRKIKNPVKQLRACLEYFV